MKKVIVMVLCLMFSLTGTVFADYSPSSKADAKKLIDSIKEIRYNVETGVNITKYDDLVSTANVNFKRYTENYPDNDRDPNIDVMYGQVLEYYTSARDVWHMGIESKYDLLNENDLAVVFANNPSLKSKLTPVGAFSDCYFYKDVLQVLWTMACDFEKNIKLPQN